MHTSKEIQKKGATKDIFMKTTNAYSRQIKKANSHTHRHLQKRMLHSLYSNNSPESPSMIKQ